MKKNKKWLAVLITVTLFLSGCSLLNDVNNTLNYANEAAEYANEASDFVNEVPPLAEQAVQEPEALKDLEIRLSRMKEDIEEFNTLEPPSVGGDLHQQIVDYNNQALQGINTYLDNMENGTLDPSVIENTETFQSLREIQSIVDQVQQLGN